GRPRSHGGDESEGRKEGGFTSTPARAPTREQQYHVDDPDHDRKHNFRIVKESRPKLLLRHNGARDQSQGHKRKAQQQRPVTDFIDDLQGRQAQPLTHVLRLQAALLPQVQHAGNETQEERGVSQKDQGNVHEDPSPAQQRRGELLGLFADRGKQSEQEDQGKNKDSRRHSPVLEPESQKERRHQESQQRFSMIVR